MFKVPYNTHDDDRYQQKYVELKRNFVRRNAVYLYIAGRTQSDG